MEVPVVLTDPGLCGRCRWARGVRTARGSGFLRCARSETEDRFPKYPRLPMVRCSGHEEPGDGVPAADGNRTGRDASQKKGS